MSVAIKATDRNGGRTGIIWGDGKYIRRQQGDLVDIMSLNP